MSVIRKLTHIWFCIFLVGCGESADTMGDVGDVGPADVFFMPNVLGMSRANAISEIRRLGWSYSIGIAHGTPSTYPGGTIFKQDPNPGIPVLNRRVVVIHVSAEQILKVPEINGMDFADATRVLSGMGMPFRHERGPGDDARGGEPMNSCERRIWYPVVSSHFPGVGREWREGDPPIVIITELEYDVIDVIPPRGTLCESPLGE